MNVNRVLNELAYCQPPSLVALQIRQTEERNKSWMTNDLFLAGGRPYAAMMILLCNSSSVATPEEREEFHRILDRVNERLQLITCLPPANKKLEEALFGEGAF